MSFGWRAGVYGFVALCLILIPAAWIAGRVDAIPATTSHHTDSASAWDAFTRPTLTYQGLTYITNLSAPLFIHQFSHAWFDFRNKRDKYTNYFNNSVTATQAHKLMEANKHVGKILLLPD